MSDQFLPSSAPRLGESQADYRERMTLIQAEAVERRQQELSEQRSPTHTAADRIRIWERLHQLQMPRSSSHPLINVIATGTGLSLDEVLAEQSLRAAAQATAVTG